MASQHHAAGAVYTLEPEGMQAGHLPPSFSAWDPQDRLGIDSQRPFTLGGKGHALEVNRLNHPSHHLAHMGQYDDFQKDPDCSTSDPLVARGSISSADASTPSRRIIEARGSGLVGGRLAGLVARGTVAARRLWVAVASTPLPPPATALKGLAMIGVVALLVFGMQRLLADPEALQFIVDYARLHPGRVVPLYMLANIGAPLVLLPSAPFQILAGAIWGMPLGMVISGSATYIANLCAFSVGRNFFQASLSSFISSKVATFPAIQAAILSEGWRLVLMLRISPVMPDSLMNYALSLTHITFNMFAAVTATAMVPWTTLYVYLGAASKNIIETLSGKTSHGGEGKEGGGWVNVVVMIISFCTAAAAVVYLGRVIRRAVQKASASLAAGASVPGMGIEGLQYSAVAPSDDPEALQPSARGPLAAK